MTPRERIVVRAVVRALHDKRHHDDMDALATSMSVPEGYFGEGTRRRAALMLQALLDRRED